MTEESTYDILAYLSQEEKCARDGPTKEKESEQVKVSGTERNEQRRTEKNKSRKARELYPSDNRGPLLTLQT